MDGSVNVPGTSAAEFARFRKEMEQRFETLSGGDPIPLTASRALVSDSSGNIAVSAVTSTELGYLDGVTSSVQTQLNQKAAKSHGTHVSYGAAAPAAAGTASAGSAATVSRSDHVHPAQTTVSGNAGSATKLAAGRTIDGVSFNGSANITHYGSCSTAAATAAKVVACPGFSLGTGATITVKFTVTNTASNPTLNVNGTGAKAIYYRGAAIPAGYLAANRTYKFVYNGTQYDMVGDVDTNTTYTAAAAAPLAAGTAAVGTSTKYAREDHRHPAQTTVTGNAGSATKLATARTIDGVSFNGSANITHYGSCSTAAATAAKVVACPGFSLGTGATITVKFTVTNTASNPTLNVNGTGAKAIYYRGAAIPAGYLAANRTYKFVYNGTQYELVGDVDTNTTYTAATATPLAAGTAAVGTSTKYAREDHRHPAQTTVSGNAGSATKLATARTIRTNLGSTSTASFDGTANVTPGVTGTLPVINGGTGNTSVDTTPTSGSKKMVTSGGVYTALSGKAPSSHNHAAGNITSGTLPIIRGGTGVTSLSALKTELGVNIYAGSYTGNGSATPRTIDTGAPADSNIVVIWSDVLQCVTLVAGSGGCITKSQTSVSGKLYTECNFHDGVITLATTLTQLNKSGETYYYRVLRI